MNGLIPHQSLKVKNFHHPFVYILNNFQTENYCSFCLRAPMQMKKKLFLCTNCRLARYCDRECQRQAWLSDHKKECSRLKISFPNLPLTDVLFLARLVDKLNFLKKHGDVHRWEKERKFDQMMSHEKETRGDPEKMARFERIYEKTRKFFEGGKISEDENDRMPNKEEFFLIFCRSWINSHSIHASVGTEIGMALDLGISYYDHNCRPNATLVLDGFRAVLRPLKPNLDVTDYSKTFISYVDVGRSKRQRQQQLWSQWYFTCQCERCLDPDDDRLTAIRCANPACTQAIMITEDSQAEDVQCNFCQTVTTKEKIQKAQELMNSVPAKLSINDIDSEKCLQMLDQAKELLHPENVYLTRLMTAYTEMTGGQDEVRCGVDTLVTVYENYKRYYPDTDRHIGYHLLHLIKALIKRGRRSEVTPYAYEAMNIFEVCFGIEHPYYLKTLALWTYLENGAEKKDEELFELMNFNYNRPVDLVSLIEKP